MHGDRRVTFRLRAPDAARVELVGEVLQGQGPQAMTKGADGVWSITIGPLPPEIWIYNFRVQGVELQDPSNISVMPRAAGTAANSNFVEVPGEGPAYYDARPVPHGDVRMVLYESKAMGVNRYMWVYTPPGYDRSGARYPVYYLLHGNGETQSGWVANGRANLILDNLIAEKKAAPMIVVMPFAYAYPWHVGAASEKQRADFEKDLLSDLIPFVQSNYRVAADREHRALAGLSMGGGLTLAIGPRHLDTFSRLAVFSSGAGQAPEKTLADVGANAKTVNAQLKLLWIGVGTEDGAMAGAKRTSDFLNSAGIKHTYKTTPGAHTWIVWRKYLYEVAPQIFPATS
jgi:enterochelin esterase family protein